MPPPTIHQRRFLGSKHRHFSISSVRPYCPLQIQFGTQQHFDSSKMIGKSRREIQWSNIEIISDQKLKLIRRIWNWLRLNWKEFFLWFVLGSCIVSHGNVDARPLFVRIFLLCDSFLINFLWHKSNFHQRAAIRGMKTRSGWLRCDSAVYSTMSRAHTASTQMTPSQK